jgi:hypothetical protein
MGVYRMLVGLCAAGAATSTAPATVTDKFAVSHSDPGVVKAVHYLNEQLIDAGAKSTPQQIANVQSLLVARKVASKAEVRHPPQNIVFHCDLTDHCDRPALA